MDRVIEFLGLGEFVTTERMLVLARAFLLVVAGFILARIAGSAAGRLAARRFAPQGAMMVKRLVHYGLLMLVLAASLQQLGFQLTVLLGAAGVLTVALGFASQTAASNLISGLFVIAERPFAVGDVIRVADITGEVLSVDLLSVKVRTFDNLFVRVPNEEIIKSRITTFTRFPIRRVDFVMGVDYEEDLDRVQRILLETADRNPLSLEEPRPQIFFQRFGESAVELQFSVWGARENYVELKNRILLEIKTAFDAAGVKIPFPHRTLAPGNAPLPVRLVGPDA